MKRLPDFDYQNTKMSNLIDEYIHNEKYREILKRRYLDGCAQEVLASEVGMSPRQVQNIIYQFQQKVLLPHKDELL